MPNLTSRQEKLLELLQTNPSASIQEIEALFGVSVATAYRDAQALVAAGLAVKTNGGIKKPPKPAPSQPDRKCYFCSATVNDRSAFIIQMQDGSQRSACCPHCGLMALDQPGVQAALTSDFLYGRMVNARQATFLFESAVNLCCEPSVICFANEDQALKFQAGFGGQVYTLEGALIQLKKLMELP